MASSELPALNTLVQAFIVLLNALVILLTTSPILTYTGSLALGLVPARVFMATVRLPPVTLGTIFQLIRNHSGALKLIAQFVISGEEKVFTPAIVSLPVS